MTPAKRTEQRLRRLQEHLKRENPVLVESVNQYRELDAIAQKIGLLRESESYATQISWWPMISILGTFSAGKSSFINYYLDTTLQRTGNQAVDDRFTVITYSPDGQIRTLPGLALDSDPRFPFYQISEEIEQVSSGEGAKIDNYLQMKVVPSEKLKGRILIDSPGFDADEQRKATLRITDHIIELSDLVLVFFDARHPEPGAMQDTLEHLVRGALRRNDSSKFLFILNQIDTSAREDNLEDIVSSWQKALVQHGLSAGSFYILFNDKLAQPVEDQQVWARYVAKRDADYARILGRIEGVNQDRVYRIVGALEGMANQIEQQAVPRIREALFKWRRHVLITDGIVIGGIIVGLLVLSLQSGYWDGLSFRPPWFADVQSSMVGTLAAILLPLGALIGLHYFIRAKWAQRIASKLSSTESYGDLSNAFLKNTRFWHSIFHSAPVGWSGRVQNRLDNIRYNIDRFVQHLNDRFANPTGKQAAETNAKTANLAKK